MIYVVFNVDLLPIHAVSFSLFFFVRIFVFFQFLMLVVVVLVQSVLVIVLGVYLPNLLQAPLVLKELDYGLNMLDC